MSNSVLSDNDFLRYLDSKINNFSHFLIVGETLVKSAGIKPQVYKLPGSNTFKLAV